MNSPDAPFGGIQDLFPNTSVEDRWRTLATLYSLLSSFTSPDSTVTTQSRKINKSKTLSRQTFNIELNYYIILIKAFKNIGFSAYNRFKSHQTSIRNKTTSNAFARHLAQFHPDKVTDYTGFKVKVERTYKKCLDRQVSEGINIFANADKLDIQMNSKLDFHGPSATKTTTSREVPTRQPRRRRGKK